MVYSRVWLCSLKQWSDPCYDACIENFLPKQSCLLLSVVVLLSATALWDARFMNVLYKYWGIWGFHLQKLAWNCSTLLQGCFCDFGFTWQWNSPTVRLQGQVIMWLWYNSTHIVAHKIFCNVGPSFMVFLIFKHRAHLNSLLDYCRRGIDEGAKLICGGKRVEQPGLYFSYSSNIIIIIIM